MRLNCMIVDDDSMSRVVLKKLINKTYGLVLSHELDNAKDALDVLIGESSNDVDLIFLDVEMPEMTGMDLVTSLHITYNIILVTSKEEYAIEAFEGAVADYLVKPVEYERFLRSVAKVKENLKKEAMLAEKEDHICVKCDGKLYRLTYNDILYIEALSDYVIFHTDNKKHIVHYTMKGVEKKLPSSIFSRVHRSYIINRNKVNKIEDYHVFIGNQFFVIGASYREAVISRFNIL